MDGSRDSYTKWSQSESERQIPYGIAYIWNLINGTNAPIHRGGKKRIDFEKILMFSKREERGWRHSYKVYQQGASKPTVQTATENSTDSPHSPWCSLPRQFSPSPNSPALSSTLAFNAIARGKTTPNRAPRNQARPVGETFKQESFFLQILCPIPTSQGITICQHLV